MPARYNLNQTPYEYAVKVTNRFKGLDLVNSVLEELWMEVSTISYRRQWTKPPKGKEKQEGKVVVWGDFANSWRNKRGEKSKGERERYSQLHAEFQRIAWRDKKAFFNEQCIKLEENNRREKTRYLFWKIENIKGIFCPKMSTIKDRNSRDLVDTENNNKRWKEYTEEPYKKRSFWTRLLWWCGQSLRARHSGVRSQVDLRKHCC